MSAAHTIEPVGNRSTRRARLTALAALLVLFVVPWFEGSAAHAHSGNQSYVYLEVFDTAIAGRVEYPIKDLNRVLDIEIPVGEPETLSAVLANADLIQSYTRQHLAIGPVEGGSPWSYEFGDVELLDLGGNSYATFDFELTDRFDPPPRTFVVSYDGIVEADSNRSALLIIATDWGSGTFNNESNELVRFSAGDTVQIVDLDDPSWWKGMTGVIELGAEHIRIGTDHILFVLALVLPSVLVFRASSDDETERWHPSARFGSSLWRVLKIVSMFTIAHSITLALGGLGYVELSPRLVETIIALSIAAAALHNIHPIFVNKEWVMAFGFGLFHGFGFAGLLSELGLDRSRRVPSLLGFNIGVELGQAAIILMVFPILFILRRTRIYMRFLNFGSIGLAVIAMAWATERIFDYDTRVNDLVDPVMRWPRSAILIAVGYAIAIALWWFDRSRGQLVDTGPAASEQAADEPPHLELIEA